MKTIKAIIEIPKDSEYKYELSKGHFMVDRPLNQPCPFNYGYIENTLAGDGDPLDVFIITTQALAPLSTVKVEIDSILICVDNKKRDDKLICKIVDDKVDINKFTYSIIRSYLQTYKSGMIIKEHLNKEEANNILKESYKKFKNEKRKRKV